MLTREVLDIPYGSLEPHRALRRRLFAEVQSLNAIAAERFHIEQAQLLTLTSRHPPQSAPFNIRTI
jgi:hypothetical protein